MTHLKLALCSFSVSSLRLTETLLRSSTLFNKRKQTPRNKQLFRSCSQMQHLKLMTHIRNCFKDRVFNLIIGSAPLNWVHASYAKGHCYATNSNFAPCPSGEVGETTTSLSDIDVLVNKICLLNGENEVMASLINDEVCGSISVNHTLVDTLLCRFKDDWKSALSCFRWAALHPCYEHLPEAWDMMVDILGKARQFDRMRELVGEMRERNLVTLKTVAIIMRRFCGARRWEDAVRLFDELGTFGLGKNTESMNVLLDTLCKEKQVEMARGIFLELKSHYPPSAHTFNIFVYGWCKIKRVEEAYWTLQEMKGYGFAPSVISFSIIIQSYCKQSNWDKVFELLEVMEAQGCQPNVVTYTVVISSLAKAEKLEVALNIADRAKSSECKPDTLFYNSLIYTLGQAWKLREAVDVFKVEMPKNGVTPNTSTYNTLIDMFCRHGQLQMALDILQDMEDSGICKPDVRTFYPLLKASFQSGMIDGYLSKLLEDMVKKHHLSLDVSTYSLLIHGYCRVDRCESAFHLFEEMIRKELIPLYHTCRMLLDKVKERNMYDAAERVEFYIKHLKASRKQGFPGSNTSIASTE